ncbi:TolB-like translocation protein [Nonomuraea gerenzanensis]|uniref:hypothetical protein n=1 Tax=Nonomuraea gerenzanensis TaxID=93944 RepID=UPI001CD99BB0|nr:hypothetical protein [Nonomuraea gerenzanensis]UBU11126.1 hypothetical protein LCN96_43505 [Nonomuraea gerenzanensis]
MALDLRTGETRRLTTHPAGRVRNDEPHLAISADGTLFATSPENIAKTTITDFDTGETKTIDNLCRLYGLTPAGVLGSRHCTGDSDLRWVAPGRKPRIFEALNRNDRPSLSPDGRNIAVKNCTLLDATTGKPIRSFPIPATSYWLDPDHLLAMTGDDYYAANIRTGSITELNITTPPHQAILLGRWR